MIKRCKHYYVKKLDFFSLTCRNLKLNGYLCTPQSAFWGILYINKN